jgi:hypothetical protein
MQALNERSRSDTRGGGRRGAGWRAEFVAFVCCVAIAAVPAAALAESGRKNMAKEAGVGFGSALATLVYAPVKLVYATGGLVVGGLAWAFSGGDKDVADVVLTPSLRGNYVVTPAHLKRQEELEFFGRKPEYRTAEDRIDEGQGPDVASAPEGW